MSEPITTLVDLLRHGEPVGGKRYRGQLDDPLSELGWREMRDAVGSDCPWDVIVTSPLVRCAAFARELAGRHGRPLVSEPRLKEIGFGAWEGRTAAELLSEDPERLRRFWSDPVRHTPPGAEPLAAFRDRVVAAWEDLLARHEGARLLIVCHAGVIRMLVRHALDMPLERLFRIHVPSASLTRLAVERNGTSAQPRLLSHAGRL